jgi:hypothetical protein
MNVVMESFVQLITVLMAPVKIPKEKTAVTPVMATLVMMVMSVLLMLVETENVKILLQIFVFQTVF